MISSITACVLCFCSTFFCSISAADDADAAGTSGVFDVDDAWRRQHSACSGWAVIRLPAVRPRAFFGNVAERSGESSEPRCAKATSVGANLAAATATHAQYLCRRSWLKSKPDLPALNHRVVDTPHGEPAQSASARCFQDPTRHLPDLGRSRKTAQNLSRENGLLKHPWAMATTTETKFVFVILLSAVSSQTLVRRALLNSKRSLSRSVVFFPRSTRAATASGSA